MQSRGFRLPIWFRAVLMGFFLLVIGVLALVKNGGVREVLASTLLDRMLRDYVPVFEQTIALPRSAPEPANGAYYVNGMFVKYRTLPAPIGAAETLRRFDEGLHKTGYVMLLTIRPGRDDSGRPNVRLSQHDLSRLDPKFRAEIPGLPVIPGARNRVLVRSAYGRQATSLMFTVRDTADSAAAYYQRELAVQGWRRLEAPSNASFAGLRTLFFQKEASECYVVAGAGGRAGESAVMIMLTEKASS